MPEPTHGDWTGPVGFQIDEGHCAGASPAVLSVVSTFYSPGAIHHGEGVLQPINDERASDEQKDSLFFIYIMSGEDPPAGTMFQSFSVIIEKVETLLFAPITFEWDLDKRSAKIEVPEAVRARSEPIRNSVTDTEHQMISVLPNGWVFHEAEQVAGVAKGTGAIKFGLNRRHRSMAHVAWGPNGLVHSDEGYKQKFGRP